MPRYWSTGDIVARDELLGLQPDEVTSRTAAEGVWLQMPVHVVEDTAEHLVTYTAPGAQFRFPAGNWPTPTGRHPWSDRGGVWSGNGCLMVQRPGEHLSIWHFWDGDDRAFACWYLNLQTAFVRTPTGFSTQDLELDIIVLPDGQFVVKDDEVLDDRVTDGRYTSELVSWIRAFGDDLTARLRSEGPWWDLSWAQWTPPDDWIDSTLPVD